MKKILTYLILLVGVTINAQNNTGYPEAQKGFKRVDLLLPYIENQNDYKIEVKFGIITSLTECEEGSFSFKADNLEKKYDLPKSRQFPYYVLERSNSDIIVAKKSECNSSAKVDKKILSSQNLLIEYQSSYTVPFYIPETWTLEYRIWAASDYISIDR